MQKQLLFNCAIRLIILSFCGTEGSGSDPLDCDFETGFCNWKQDSDDDFDWSRNSGATFKNNTGLNGDHTTADGYYAHIDTSSEDFKNNGRAVLISTQKPNGTFCFAMWYYMYGKHADTLKVFKSGKYGWKQLFAIIGSQEKRWIRKTITVSSQSAFQIVIYGSFNYSDSGDYGVIAMDDILMFSSECKEECDNLTPTFGSVDSKNVTTGSVVGITCMGGYTLKGRPSVICLANGAWSERPECNPIDCGPKYISNGYFTAVNGTGLGQTAWLSCDVGYILKGSETVECTETGWNGTEGQCIINESYCLTPRIANGGFVIFSGSKTFNSSLNFDEGYRLQGTMYITCQADENWTKLPTCLIINCSDPTPFSGHANSLNFQYKSQLEITCNPGYTLVGNSSVICQANGNWSNNPVCEPLDSSSKPLTILYIVGPVVFVTSIIIILTIWLRNVFYKKNICFPNKTRKGKAQSGNGFCNMTNTGYDTKTESDRELFRTKGGGNTEDTKAQKRNEKNIFTVDYSVVDTVTINAHENDDSAVLHNTDTEVLETTYSNVSKNSAKMNLKSEYDTTLTFSRSHKNVQSKEQNNKYDLLEVNTIFKRRGAETPVSMQTDLDPTYDHIHAGDTRQLHQNDYSHVMEIPLKST